MWIISLFTFKKVRLQNLQLNFLVILLIFDLDSHGQSPVKIELVMFGPVFMKLRKLRSLYWENKKLDFHKTLIFSLFKSFPILLVSSIGQTLFSKNWSIETQPRSQGEEVDWYKLLKIVIYIFQIWCTVVIHHNLLYYMKFGRV